MKRKQRRTGWHLGGARAPSWVHAPCADAIKARTKEDLALLRQRLTVDALPDDHPVSKLWNANTPIAAAEARFELHHLASDLRLIGGVPGAGQLIAAMVHDVEHYADYRYELRIAGGVARATGQQLTKLGGKGAGADVEVRTPSGTKFGIACFRASSVTPHIAEAAGLAQRLATEFAVIAGTTQLVGHRIGMIVEFDNFPVSEQAAEDAVHAFAQHWADTTASGPARVGNVSVWRAHVEPLRDSWEVRITLRFPIPTREKRRLVDKVRGKMERETFAWARSFPGVAVLAIEESDFALGLREDSIAPMLRRDAEHAFAGLLVTWPFFVDHPRRGSRYRVEDVKWYGRQSGTTDTLTLHTFGQNTVELGKGHMLVEHQPTHAEDRWMLRPGPAAEVLLISHEQGLEITRCRTRLKLRPGEKPTQAELLGVVRAVRLGEPHA